MVDRTLKSNYYYYFSLFFVFAGLTVCFVCLFLSLQHSRTSVFLTDFALLSLNSVSCLVHGKYSEDGI